MDTGTAYGRPEPAYDATLVEVGPGTPAGEMLRRYYEAQVGQGAITFHSEERLTSTDRGVVMFRRKLREQIDAVRDGRDPLGVVFDEAAALVTVEAGNDLVQPA